jgi:hypothetical protein
MQWADIFAFSEPDPDESCFWSMSALGQTRRFRDVHGMSGLTPTADISGLSRHFALVPDAELRSERL